MVLCLFPSMLVSTGIGLWFGCGRYTFLCNYLSHTCTCVQCVYWSEWPRGEPWQHQKTQGEEEKWRRPQKLQGVAQESKQVCMLQLYLPLWLLLGRTWLLSYQKTILDIGKLTTWRCCAYKVASVWSRVDYMQLLVWPYITCILMSHACISIISADSIHVDYMLCAWNMAISMLCIHEW